MIYKVLTLNEWKLAKKTGVIITNVDKNDGFVHLSTARQLNATLSMYFQDSSKVMLLEVSYNKVLKAPLSRSQNLEIYSISKSPYR